MNISEEIHLQSCLISQREEELIVEREKLVSLLDRRDPKVIMALLDECGIAELSRKEEDVLTIRYRTFFRSEKEFHFELNSKAVHSFKSKAASVKKINYFLLRGFALDQTA